jgi:hypothetical protein
VQLVAAIRWMAVRRRADGGYLNTPLLAAGFFIPYNIPKVIAWEFSNLFA